MALAALALALAAGHAEAATQARQGDRIVNVVSVGSSGLPEGILSGPAIIAVRIPVPASIELLVHAPASPRAQPEAVAPGSYLTGPGGAGAVAPLPLPMPVGSPAPLDLSRSLPLVPTTSLHQGDPVFIRVTDLDQNLDRTVRETVRVTLANDVTGDGEEVVLTEDGPDTGVFVGYLPSTRAPPPGGARPYDGVLQVLEQSRVTARYADPVDGNDTAASSAVVDPPSLVFDSRTGLPVSGAEVTVLDTASGRPAAVLSDDGRSSFPSAVVSGQSVTDGAGRVHVMGPGQIRFPFLTPGTYRYDVRPPAGYRAPSTVPDADLQALPGAPFATAAGGSRGDPFLVDAGPGRRIDVPVDRGDGALWVQKTASKERVGVGDFLAYEIVVTNLAAAAPAAGVRVVDTLPAGFRYEPGSTQLNGAPATDPAVSPDGRTLTFDIGSVAPSAAATLRLAVRVGARATIGRVATNQALARGAAGPTSNVATAAVRVGDDFFTTRSVIVGRVTSGACIESEGGVEAGLGGVRIFLEDGTFADSDKRGLFHFEGVRKGLHVVQLDLDSLPEGWEAVACAQTDRFAGRAFSQFVDVQGGALWRADFHVRRRSAGPSPEPPPPPPPPGPARPESPPADPPPSAGAAPGTAPRPREPLVIRRLVEFNFSPLGVDLGREDRAKLEAVVRTLPAARIERLVVTGYTDALPIRARAREAFPDNAALALARARSVGRYLLSALDLPAEILVALGKGEIDPVASNRKAAGRALNRRALVLVEGVLSQVQPAPAEPGVAAPVTATSPSAPSFDPAAPAPSPATPVSPPAVTAPPSPVVGAAPEVTATPAVQPPAAGGAAASAPPDAPAPPAPVDGILSPSDGELLADRIGSVQIRVASYLQATLLVDGKPVDAARVGYKREDREAGKTTSTYVGVDFGEKGRHTLALMARDPFGNVRLDQTATVTRTGEIASIRFVSAEGNVADGRTPVRLRLELRDAAGDVIRGSTRLELRSGALQPLRREGENLTLEDAAASRRVWLDRDGWALFQPVTASGSYRAVLGTGATTVEAETWVVPKMRDWVLVGLAEGTAGYNLATGNIESLRAGEQPEELYSEGRVAFYAKGQIQGKWLLTMAFDSARPPPRVGDGLFQVIDPQTYYTLYGDAGQQAYDAASARKLYVKLEREQFYALFGDYDTGLTVTELSRYGRRMNGVKAELQTPTLEVAAFGAQTDQVYARDEIPGDGTSGLYHLSRQGITSNSETVTVVARDRFHSETVVSSQPMTRFADYAIDYVSGTLFFREPIPSRDPQLNPITIVVEYEALSPGGQDYTAGGRAGVKLLGQALRAGVTVIHEGQGDRKSELYGADARVQLTESTRLRGELAVSNARGVGGNRTGDAFLAELTHSSRTLDAKLYLREQQAGFGLGQQSGTETGTRKLGLEGAYRFDDRLGVSAQAYRQETFGTGAQRLLAESRLSYLGGPYSGYVGALDTTDTLADGTHHTSGQLTLGGKWLALGERLTLGLDYAQSVWGNGSEAFPTRLALRTEYRLSSAVALLAAQEMTWGAGATTQNTRVGLRSTPWKGGTLTGSVDRQLGENSQRVFGNVGLRQAWQLTDEWKVDVGGERSMTLRQTDAYLLNPNVPPASGTIATPAPGRSERFTALSAGANYQVRSFVWDSRAEFRTATSETRWTLLSGIVSELGSGWAWSGRGQYLGSSGPAGVQSTSLNLRGGLVYRPPRTTWILLDRIDWIVDRRAGGSADLDSQRLVNNVLANWRPAASVQLSLGYGAKYARERIAGGIYRGYTEQVSIEGRHDLARSWDVGFRASVLHGWSGGQVVSSAGPSVGYSPAANVWLGLGFNVAGYGDRDFSAASYTASGPYLRMRLKFDQSSVRDAATWLNKQ